MNLEKKKARQARYLKKKKVQGFQYVQIWVPVQEQDFNDLKLALSQSSSREIKEFINHYLQSSNKQEFSNDPLLIKQKVCELLYDNPQLSSRKISQILFDQYKLCMFTKKIKKPSAVKTAIISKIIAQCLEPIHA